MTLIFLFSCFLLYLNPSLSFSLLLLAFKVIMPYSLMNFLCKKSSVHFSFLGISSNSNVNINENPSSKCGLGLIANETPRVPNVIESSSVIKPQPQPPLKRKDPGGIGFIDDIGGGVDGLMSCTESLGFESCDERRVDDDDGDGGDGDGNDGHDHEDDNDEMMMMMVMARDAWRRKRIEEKRERNNTNKKFPPPLSSLNQNGQPCFYLKPVRKNGRLELTEVRIQRPEILRAVRQNGRLTLHLVSSDVCPTINEEEEEQEETNPEEQEQELHFQQEEEDEDEDEEEVKLQEEEEEEKVEEIGKYKVSGEGFRRCHELVMSRHHHHHIPNINVHVWRQPCVTR